MFKQLSKTGLIFLGLFLLLVVYSFYESQTCSGMFCGYVIFLPALPWVFLMEINGFPANLETVAYILSLLINSFIFYGIGLGIEKLVLKIRNKSNSN